MHCACVSELACMHVVITFETGKYSFRAFSYKASGGLIHARINLSCSEKCCFRGSQTRMHNACVYYRRMPSVLLLLTPSLNDPSTSSSSSLEKGFVNSSLPSEEHFLNKFDLDFFCRLIHSSNETITVTLGSVQREELQSRLL